MRGGASVSRTSVERKVVNFNINKNNNNDNINKNNKDDNNNNKSFFAKDICRELIENIGC